MPPVIPFIPLIIGLASTGIEMGLQMSNKPGTPDLSKAGETSPLTAAQNRAQTAAVTQTLPNLQALTGGSVSPEYAANFGALQSGLANDPQATGNIQQAINQFFGLTAPGDKSFTPTSMAASPGLNSLDLFSKASPGKGLPTGIPGGDFIGEMFNADSLKGLAA